MLEVVKGYNDISPKLREKIEERLDSYGTKVRYRFNISRPNPDPLKYNGDTIWPFQYTLDPITFKITDHDEDRKDKQKVKTIGMVDRTDAEGKPESFRRVRVYGSDKGIVTLDIGENPEDREMAFYLELHPKMSNGLFKDPQRIPIVERIDDITLASTNRSTRLEKQKALTIAMGMTDEQVKQFGNAMQWELSDIGVWRDKLEAEAENNPKMFSDLVGSKKIEYQALIQDAVSNKIIAFDPVEYKYHWASNNETILVLGGPVDGKTELERFAEWFMTAGDKADEVLKKIKSLSKAGSKQPA